MVLLSRQLVCAPPRLGPDIPRPKLAAPTPLKPLPRASAVHTAGPAGRTHANTASTHKGIHQGCFMLYTSGILTLVVQTVYEQYYLFVTCVQPDLGCCSSGSAAALVINCYCRVNWDGDKRGRGTSRSMLLCTNTFRASTEDRSVRHLPVRRPPARWHSFLTLSSLVTLKKGIGCSNFSEVLQ